VKHVRSALASTGLTFSLGFSLAAALAAAACNEIVVFDDDLGWPEPDDLPQVGAGKVIITNSGDDTLSWIDVTSLENVYTQPVGLLPPEREGPHHGAVAKDGKSFFVGLSNYVPGSGSGPHGAHGTGTVDGYLLKYDVATLELLGTARVSRSPGDVRITPDGTKVIQSHYDVVRVTEWLEKGGPIEDSYAPVAIVDPTTMNRELVKVCPTPHGIGIANDSSAAYVSCAQSDEIGIVGLAAPHEVTRVPIGATANDPSQPPAFEPYSLQVHPQDGTIWSSHLKTGDIRVLDPVSKQWMGTPIVVGGVPFFGTFSADGALYFAAVQGSNSLVVIDTAMRKVLATLPMASEACYLPHSVLLLAGEKKALVVCEGDHTLPTIGPGTVAVIDVQNPATPTLVKFITVGVFPDDAILVLPPGQGN
jgi:DNA-binding beta-propeller fold protein YncE